MKLDSKFYAQDALIVAPKLIGKLLVRKLLSGEILKLRITETECYLGEEDTASHARFGKTNRNSIMYEQGGTTYVYLCYGIHSLFNIVTGEKNNPQAVLIRGVENYNGPGKLTKIMQIDRNLNNLNLTTTSEIWLEDDNFKCKYKKAKRVGINYATKEYLNKKWRFIMI